MMEMVGLLLYRCHHVSGRTSSWSVSWRAERGEHRPGRRRDSRETIVVDESRGASDPRERAFKTVITISQGGVKALSLKQGSLRYS